MILQDPQTFKTIKLPDIGVTENKNCQSLSLFTDESYFETITLGWDFYGLSSFEVVTSDVRKLTSGRSRAAAWQTSFTPEMPLIGFYGS